MHYKARECGYYLIKHRLSVYGLSSCDSPIFGLDPFGGHRLRRLCHLSESVFEADRARSGFAIAENCSPQRVVVVDDVYTTGAHQQRRRGPRRRWTRCLRRIRDSLPRQSRLPPRGGVVVGLGSRDRPTSDHRNSQRGLANLHRARATSIRGGRPRSSPSSVDTRSGDQIGTCWPIQPDRRRVTLAGEVV